MKNEILEVEIELGGGETHSMNIKECDDWEEIEEGTRAILGLINGQQMLVTISSADEFDGVSFKVEGMKHTMFYEADMVSTIYVEVNN